MTHRYIGVVKWVVKLVVKPAVCAVGVVDLLIYMCMGVVKWVVKWVVQLRVSPDTLWCVWCVWCVVCGVWCVCVCVCVCASVSR